MSPEDSLAHTGLEALPTRRRSVHSAAWRDLRACPQSRQRARVRIVSPNRHRIGCDPRPKSRHPCTITLSTRGWIAIRLLTRENPGHILPLLKNWNTDRSGRYLPCGGFQELNRTASAVVAGGPRRWVDTSGRCPTRAFWVTDPDGGGI